MKPRFFELDEILELHGYLIERFGGSDGVRDIGLLESAIAMPAAGFGDEYLHKDVYEMAAAYLFHIVQNHPFIDGNKRAGAVTAMAFLEMNGAACKVTDDELVEFVLAVAQGRMEKPDIARFFREHATAGADRSKRRPKGS